MIEVWRIDVRRGFEGAEVLLSRDESDRAARFRFEPDRRSFVVTRAALRSLLGSRLGVFPEDVVFAYGPNGKPEVSGISFNASHAGALALVAIGPGRIGVDVEAMRPEVEMRALARRFFTESENAALDPLGDDDLVRAFYGCWTQKEAFVKAVGEGLSFELDRVEVAVWPSAPALVSLDGGAPEGWTVAGVEVGPGYAAAVAADTPDAEVVVRDWAASAAA